MITKANRPLRHAISLRLMSSKRPRLVSIEHKDIVDRSSDLRSEIRDAYSSAGKLNLVVGLGILVVKNIPGYEEARRRLLPLGKELGELPDSGKKKLEAPEVLYQVGWSHGIEKFKGKPDFLKGSFYANVLFDEYDSPLVDRAHNKWPTESIPDLEHAFKNLSRLMFNVGGLLSFHIDNYVHSIVPAYELGKLSKIFNL